MTKKKVNHVHKFKRHVYDSGYEIFFCTLPDCNYKVKRELALGKENICWRCGRPHIINEYSIRLARPHCDDCKKGKKLVHVNVDAGAKRVAVFKAPDRSSQDVTSDLRSRLLSTLGELEEIDPSQVEKDLL
jgi:hypothetical protein